eukprot:TRINITY_DN3145_c0_g1_i1.p1 TRINITY_DN3145_c0_g1~~TRINITY_DN3145_c0_g1_i1.p1  ORF type:complete len:393 (-),score=63.26 TRINITY_DN3145_c0_g1_i1:80-1258(-)
MALARLPPSSCSIFVGNMPYDANEDELKEIFGRAGNVASVRIVVDKETRQPKGYAFVDFGDSVAVQAAIEKLNNYEYNGRKLRVDGAERELSATRITIDPRAPPTRGGPTPTSDPPPLLPPQPTVQDRMAMLREQAALEEAKATATESAARSEVARIMETLTPLQLLHLVGEMQRLTLSAPEVARALVGENVQLGLALAHAEFLVGLLQEPGLPTDAEVKERAKSVREKLWYGGGPPVVAPRPIGVVASGAAIAVPAVPGLMPSPPSVVPPPPPGVAPLGVSPVRFVASPVPAYGPMLGATAPAPVQQVRVAPYPQTLPGTAAHVPPRAPAAATVVPPVSGGLNLSIPSTATQEQRSLLERLMQLSPEQIDQLPDDQKKQLLQFLEKLPPAT